MQNEIPTPNTLAIDIGGSGLKAAVLDAEGEMITDRVRIDTPTGAAPGAIVELLAELVKDLPDYGRVGVGFPGMVREGIVRSAPNLGNDGWSGFPLAAALQEALGKPVRIANDADVQGLAVITGKGLEMVITLGTGFGTGLYDNGRMAPHLEIAHQPFRKGETYDQQLGNAGRKEAGNDKWQKNVLRAIDKMRNLTGFDHMFIGGGNSKKLQGKLPEDVTIVDNSAGIRGAVYLWRDEAG
ncbi:MAG: ROK family protein [Akkermansiaceae bacterium]|jgi:polyphosphate glucokinase|nr:ROK family protein [Akkermansiaceae bacterium]MDP4646714.1 ROK family protein [Akkermansiaceae bacterium]MDP4721077.1 ROK family protein [Akkermansiaceae bacterium]MDP4779630.1 ROK family protein [Akkermansiaceae bacterium]MDP4846290.1 ROK family protein [Akkermansiaceae bacterium]